MTNKHSFGYLMQDIGLVILLFCIFAGAMVVSYSEKSTMFEAVIMLLGTFL